VQEGPPAAKPAPAPRRPAYVYNNATLVRWIDGDSAQVSVDLGFKVAIQVIARLRSLEVGINTRERGQPGSVEATARVKELAPPGTGLQLHSYELDRYGRTMAALVTHAGLDIAAQLITDGYAVPWDGRGEKPIPDWPVPPPPRR
jgi:endonuclease YncB( thermonuclease family)